MIYQTPITLIRRTYRNVLAWHVSGFSLIELLIVAAVLAIVAAIAIPLFLNQKNRANDSSVNSDVKNMGTTLSSLVAKKPATITGSDGIVTPTFTIDGVTENKNGVSVFVDTTGAWCASKQSKSGKIFSASSTKGGGAYESSAMCTNATSAPAAGVAVSGSTAGTVWNTYPQPATYYYSSNDIVYGNGMFVSVTDNPDRSKEVVTSTDGINWVTRTSPAVDTWWNSVAYGNGVFVAVGFAGLDDRVMTSPDGINWTLRAAPNGNDWASVTYGNGLFVAVGRGGVGDRVMTSPDGIVWTSRTSAADSDWSGVTYGNNMFVAIANNGPGTGHRVMTSPDGINWTLRATPADNTWADIAYGNGMFVAVSYNYGGTSNVMTSSDGITWTLRTTPTGALMGVAYGNNMFVAVTLDNGSMVTSSDGITWTTSATTLPFPSYSITYGNNMFVLLSAEGFQPSGQSAVSK